MQPCCLSDPGQVGLDCCILEKIQDEFAAEQESARALCGECGGPGPEQDWRRIIPSGSPELLEQSKQCTNLHWEAQEEQEISTYAAMNWGHAPTWEVGSC